MPFPLNFPRNSGESKQTGSESKLSLAGVSAPSKIPRIQSNVPRPVPRPPNLTTLAAHSEPHCEPRKEKFARRSSGTFTHLVSCDEGDSRSMIGHGHLETWHQTQRHHRSRRQTASPTSQPQSRRKMPRSESPPSRPLTGVIATPSSNVFPLPPGESRTKKTPRAAARTPIPFGTPGLSDPRNAKTQLLTLCIGRVAAAWCVEQESKRLSLSIVLVGMLLLLTSVSVGG